MGGEEAGSNPADRAKKGEALASLRPQRRPARRSRSPARTSTTFKLRRSMFERIGIARPDATPERPQGICLDKATTALRSTTSSAPKGGGLPGLPPGRRAHPFRLNRFRGLPIRWSKKPATTTAPFPVRLRPHHLAPRDCREPNREALKLPHDSTPFRRPLRDSAHQAFSECGLRALSRSLC